MRKAVISRKMADAAGIGLLETLLLTFVLAGAMLAGVFWLKARDESLRAERQASVLQQAERHLNGFVAANFRLPCPASSTSNGVEDCSSGQKGLLPYRTLGIDASAGRAGIAQLRYMVYRTAGSDLAVAANKFEPSKWDGTPYNFAHIGSPDFCRMIANAGTDVITGGARVFNGAAGRPVAYALADPGAFDADGDGSPFDGRNAGTQAEMEAPERSTASGSYDDRVLARGFADLALVADCPRLTTSLDGMALAVDVIDEVNSQMLWSTLTASALTAVNIVKGNIQVVKTVIAAGVMGAAVATLSAASADLAAAIASCVVIVGCAEIPHAAAAVAAATAAVVAAGTAIAANVVAVTGVVTAMALTATVAIKTGIDLGNTKVDVSGAASKAYDSWQAATAKVADAQTLLDSANSLAASANTKQVNAWNDLLSAAYSIVNAANQAANPKGTLPLTMNDYLLNDVKAKSLALYQARTAVANAQSALNVAKQVPQSSSTTSISSSQSLIDAVQAQIDQEKAKASPDQAKIDSLQQTLDSLQTQLSGSTTEQQIATLKAQIADLQNSIASETDPDRKAQLQSNLISLQNQLASLDSGVDGKQAALDVANAQLATAQANYYASRQVAIDAFRINYCVTTTTSTTSGDPPTTTTTTTTDCSKYYDGRADITAKIDAFNSSYQAWLGRGDQQKTVQSVYDQAIASASQAKASYEMLNGVATGTTPPSAAKVTNWMGAEAILQGADAKGGSR